MALVLLDRDGVINRDAKEGVLKRENFHFLDGACAAIARLTQAGFQIAICTNQSAVGRGAMSVQELDSIHQHLRDTVAQNGGRIDAVYYAPDRPDAATDRRKPGAGMLREALQHFSADAASTYFVGDALRDLQAAHAAGCKRILVRTGQGQGTEQTGIPALIAPVVICNNLTDAVTHILANSAST